MRSSDIVKKFFKTIVTWVANFATQTWTSTMDVYGGYGGWEAATGYLPRVNYGGNGIIQWQSTQTWYYGWIINHWVETSTSTVLPTVVDGVIYGRMNTGYHTQTTSYNFFSGTAAYDADNTSVYQFIRNTNGLSFSVCSAGYYYSQNTVLKVYQNNVLIATIGTLATYNTDYTIKFKLIGNQLYVYFGTGDQRNANVTLNLATSSINPATLTGRNTIIFMSSWITNDQGESCYGEVDSISLKN